MRGDRRRLLVAAAGAGLAACLSLPALAQKVARVGILSPLPQSDAVAKANLAVLLERLRELGYVEGRTLVLESRHADGQYDRLAALAGELVKAKVDVIVTGGTPATAAAKRATATIPIVATSIDDPVAGGFARSLARPGGNVTGFSTMGGAVYEKRLELLIEAVPAAQRVGLIVNPDNAFFVRILPGLEAAAKKQGRQILLANVRTVRDLKEGFAMLATRHAEALLIGDDPFLDSQTVAVAAQALHYKLPAVFPRARGAEDGGLFSYANDLKQRFRGSADYIDKILKGAKAGELPIEQPLKLELTVNQKTAAALGVTVPPAILARANRVIQ